MNTSILIAKLIGPILFVAAFAMLANTKELQEMAHEFLKDRGLIYVTGVMAMLGGLAIINSHNIWTADWRVIITVLGWIMTIGGAIRMAFTVCCANNWQQDVGQFDLDSGVWRALAACRGLYHVQRVLLIKGTSNCNQLLSEMLGAPLLEQNRAQGKIFMIEIHLPL